MDPRRNDARVVKHQQIAWFQQPRQVGDNVFRAFALPRQVEQAGRVARHGWPLGDQPPGQVEIEQLDALFAEWGELE